MPLGCCPGCKPRWVNLVDNIYPPNLQDGLVKNNMPKLTFYALSNPQKLDRIGEYLSKRLSRDLNRNRIVYVSIAMEAMDKLLVACHSQTLNLFVESFLKMVQKLLESPDPELQCLATTSFVKFSNIEEDTPSYHRRYDFFVSQFSAMCHSAHHSAKQRIRMAGLLGIQGVIRKTVCDELQPDIWQQHHMDKIVPSLLYNMHSVDEIQNSTGLDFVPKPVPNPPLLNDGAESNNTLTRLKRLVVSILYDMHSVDELPSQEPVTEEEPAHVAAEKVFRDLICRAAYSNLKSVLLPVLSHMDSHQLWTTTKFPSACFKIIMYSVQAQYGHVVVHMLMSHLDTHSRSPAELKASITDVLSETVIVAAGGSIGPSVLDLFNSLLKHLRGSVEYTSTSDSERMNNTRFQESIINTIGEFANHLPDFQKIEIITFVINKMPSTSQNDMSEVTTNSQLQAMLLKTILKVATTYRTMLMTNAFPSSLKNPLLQLSVVNKPNTRLIVQKILHTLIDRRDSSEKFSRVWIPEDLAELDLSVDKPSRQDVYFASHGGNHILWHLMESLRLPNNSFENVESVYTTICLLQVELLTDETYTDFASFILNLQNIGVVDDRLTSRCFHQIHATVVAIANLFGELSGITEIQQHVNQVIQCRRSSCDSILPEKGIYGENYGDTFTIPATCLLDADVFREALDNLGHDTSNLSKPLPTPGSKPSKKVFVFKSSLNIDNMETYNGRDFETSSVGEIDSIEPSPTLKRSSVIMGGDDKLTFDQIKTALDSVEDLAALEEVKRQTYAEFESAPLDTIMNRAHSRNELHDRLFEILGDTADTESMDNKSVVAIDSIKYPPMFVY